MSEKMERVGCYRDTHYCDGPDCIAWDKEEGDCVFVLAARAQLIEPGFAVLDVTGETEVSCTRCAELEKERNHTRENLLSAMRANKEQLKQNKRDRGKITELSDLLRRMMDMYMPYFPVNATYADPDQGLAVVLREFEKATQKVERLEQANAELESQFLELSKIGAANLQQRDMYSAKIKELEEENATLTSVIRKKTEDYWKAQEAIIIWQKEARLGRRWARAWKRAAKAFRSRVSFWHDAYHAANKLYEGELSRIEKQRLHYKVVNLIIDELMDTLDVQDVMEITGAVGDILNQCEMYAHLVSYHEGEQAKLRESLESLKKYHHLSTCPDCGTPKGMEEPCPSCNSERERCTGCFDPNCDGYK